MSTEKVVDYFNLRLSIVISIITLAGIIWNVATSYQNLQNSLDQLQETKEQMAKISNDLASFKRDFFEEDKEINKQLGKIDGKLDVLVAINKPHNPPRPRTESDDDDTYRPKRKPRSYDEDE